MRSPIQTGESSNVSTRPIPLKPARSRAHVFGATSPTRERVGTVRCSAPRDGEPSKGPAPVRAQATEGPDASALPKTP